jgi:hypothetical protein
LTAKIQVLPIFKSFGINPPAKTFSCLKYDKGFVRFVEDACGGNPGEPSANDDSVNHKDILGKWNTSFIPKGKNWLLRP